MALSAKEAAIELDTDARTFRKFMRAVLPKEDQPGQGNRYAIDEKDIKKLRKLFAEWNTPKAKPEEVEATTNGKGKKKGKKVTEEAVDVTVDAVEVDEEPDEADLIDIEAGIDALLDEDVFELD
jgi:hypothetical protein